MFGTTSYGDIEILMKNVCHIYIVIWLDLVKITEFIISKTIIRRHVPKPNPAFR